VHKLADDYLANPTDFSSPPAPYTPPGSPIGSGDDEGLHLQCGF